MHFVCRLQQNLTKGFVGILVLGKDLGGFCMVIPQVGDDGAGSASRNVWFGSRVDWRKKTQFWIMWRKRLAKQSKIKDRACLTQD